jgi:acyl carrier protein
MKQNDIATIAAKILYLEGADPVDPDKSLFKDYGMTSLDFVDFAFELRAASHKGFQPEELWPVNGMMNNPEYFSAGTWTDAGRAKLSQLFEERPLPDALTADNLYQLFSVTYVENRLRAL